MKQPINRPALRKAGGPAKNPPVKTTGDRGNLIVRVPKDNDDMRMYEIKDAMRTLMRAEEIKSDKRMMGDVKKMAANESSKLKKLC